MSTSSGRRALLRALAGIVGLGLMGRHGRALAAATPATSTASGFRMAYFETYSPLSFRDGDAMRGLLVDIIDEVLHRRLGLAIEHTGYPWARAQFLVQRGGSDAICTIATPERLDYALAVDEPVVSAPRRVFARRDSPLAAKLKTLQSGAELKLLDPVVVSYAANGWVKANMAEYRVEHGTDFDSSMKMLIGKRGDIMVDNALVMQYSLARIDGGAAVQMFPVDMGQAHFQLLVGKQSPYAALLPQIDKALKQFKREPGYAGIFERYGIPL